MQKAREAGKEGGCRGRARGGRRMQEDTGEVRGKQIKQGDAGEGRGCRERARRGK